MSLDSKLMNLIAPLVGGRMFPDVAPLSTVKPYVTYQQVGGNSINYTGNEIPNAENALIQINTWAETREQANALAHQIEDVLRQAVTITARPEAAFTGTHEPDLKLYGTIQDFNIYSSR